MSEAQRPEAEKPTKPSWIFLTVFFCLLISLVLAGDGLSYHAKFSKAFFGGIFLALGVLLPALQSLKSGSPLRLNAAILVFSVEVAFLGTVSLFHSGYLETYYLAKAILLLLFLIILENRPGNETTTTLLLFCVPAMVIGLVLVWVSGAVHLVAIPHANYARPLELTFGNQNVLGLFLVLSAPLCAAAAGLQPSGPRRVICWAAFLCIIPLIMWTQSRNAIILGVAGGGAAVFSWSILFFSGKPRPILLPLALVGGTFSVVFGSTLSLAQLHPSPDDFGVLATIAAAGSGLLMLLAAFLVIRFSKNRARIFGVNLGFLLFAAATFSLSQSERSEAKLETMSEGEITTGRELNYMAARAIMTDSPGSLLLGNGLGAFYVEIAARDPADFGHTALRKPSLFVHQEFFEILVEGGMVAFFLRLLLVGGTVWICLRVVFRRDHTAPEERLLASCLALCCGLFYLHGLFSVAPRYFPNQVLLFVAIGVTWARFSPFEKIRLRRFFWIPVLAATVWPLFETGRQFASDRLLDRAIRPDHTSQTGLETRRLLRKAISVDPENLRAHAELFRLETRPGRDDVDQARTNFQAMEGIVPGYNRFGLQFARALFRNGQAEEACEVINDYLSFNRNDFLAHLHAISFAFLENADETLEDALEAYLTAAAETSISEGDLSVTIETVRAPDGSDILVVSDEGVEKSERYLLIREFRANALDDREGYIRAFPDPVSRLNLTLSSLLRETGTVFEAVLDLPLPDQVNRLMSQ